MALVPTNDGLVGSIAKLYEKSPSSAQILLELGTYEAMADLVEEHEGEVTLAVAKMMQAELDSAERGARRIAKRDLEAGLAPDPRLFDAFGEIRKDLQGLVGAALSIFNQQHPRGPDGRFIRVGSGSRDKDVDNSISSAIREGTITEQTPLRVKLKGSDRMTTASVEQIRGGRFNDDAIEGVFVERGDVADMPKKGEKSNAFDLTRTFMDDRMARRVTNMVTDKDGNLIGRQPGKGDRASYQALETMGSGLQRLSTPGSTASLVGVAAQMSARMGPQAEDVLGPGIRRTAYRYRGVERRPEKVLHDLSTEVAVSLDQALDAMPAGSRNMTALRAQVASLHTKTNPRTHESYPDPRSKVAPFLMAAARTAETPDMLALQAQGDVVTAALIGAVPGMTSRLPSRQTMDISMASGELPPSEGVIINADGRMVTQAHGYRGDHYLPFDLKNLKSLQGGQYVRTRGLGGPTTEDIYTGVMTGARQIQVVSNSGVFTVEFDPDLRGTRRYSDKSRQMSRRYGDLLETINDPSSGLMEVDFSPEQEREIRQEALSRVAPGDEDGFREAVKQIKHRRRFELSVQDIKADESLRDRANDYVNAKIKNDNAFHSLGYRDREAIRREMIADFMRESGEDTPRQLQLDGPGYFQALKTLQGEFPYFIRDVRFQPLNEWARERGVRGAQRLAGMSDSRRKATKETHLSPSQTALPNGSYLQGTGRRRSQPADETAASSGEQRAGATAPAPTQQTQSTRLPSSDPTRELKVAHRIKQSVRNDLRPLIGMLERTPLSAPVQPDDDLEDIKRSDFDVYIHHGIRQRKDGSGNAGEWVYNELAKATPAQLAQVDGLFEFLREVDELNPGTSNPAKTKEATDRADAAREKIMAMHPFAPSTKGDPALRIPQNVPESERALPPKTSGVPDPALPPEEFARAASSKMNAMTPHAREMLKAIEGLDDPSRIADMIDKIYDEAGSVLTKDDERNIMDINNAWSLFTAMNAHRTLAQIAGDSVPKAQGPELGPSQDDPGRQIGKARRRAPWAQASPRSVAKRHQSVVKSRLDQIYGR